MNRLRSLLSEKDIPINERLIVALDVPSFEEAQKLVNALGETVQFYKLGLEILMSGDYFRSIDWLRGKGKKIFADTKFFDVPQTVASAVAQLRKQEVEFATVHGNDAILAAACGEKGSVKILAVTVLTSLDQKDMEALGFQADIKEVVTSRARRALEIGCDGVISSGQEVPALRESLGERLIIVVPGVRPGENREVDDQKRVVGVRQAFLGGADYIVMGRPIRKAPDPRRAVEGIQSEIAAVFAEKR